ncbi:ABC transporter ATP-binding protein [Williamsia sterculiae]|uniref:Nucleoside ABC transporter ATP-binding protein n=1 Tax=Williamsia sterculiae TaxID=1344003 RepID=A0A1N7EJX2_9NOCA|nr:ABC transporter ATP-binding protein [Williamsia sterculiae]SIR88396.1 nucleoside ABC transporter ATP-binding protein [Williamsia sterculiae]
MPTVAMHEITKRFGAVLANDAVSITVREGEILALVGENGAGKSTLMSILYGIHGPDSGHITLDGEPVVFESTADAIGSGLGMVFQHFQLFPGMSVAENVVYGSEPRHRFGVLRRRDSARQVEEIATRYGLQVPATAPVDDLPVGLLQRIEIVKALYRGAQTLILDEPTGVLTPQEARALFVVLRQLAAEGRSVILITHKLDEVVAVADQVVVLRDGRTVFRSPVSETTTRELARHMTGRELDLRPRRASTAPGAAVLTVGNARCGASDDRGALDDVSVEVRAGEIVGVAGVAGNGQETLAAVVAGHRQLRAGRVILDGVDVTRTYNHHRRRVGLAHIPEDRNRDGVARDADVATNLATGFHRSAPLAVRGILRPRAIRAHATDLIGHFGIKVGGPGVAVRTLSGGNTQKVVIARELTHAVPFLLAEQPTRGVDLGAIEFIYERLDRYRRNGGGILLVSSEISELLSLSDRILVMFAGRIAGELSAVEATPERIGALMSGTAATVDETCR